MTNNHFIISPEYRVWTASILLIYSLVMTTLDFAIPERELNYPIITTLIGFASALLAVGRIWNNNSNN